MVSADIFFYIFVGTIAISRLFLAVWKKSSHGLIQNIIVVEFRIHHYVYGIIFMLGSLLFIGHTVGLVLYAIGFGLFVDEIPHLIVRKWESQDCNAWWSRFAVLCLILILYSVRAHLVFAAF